MERFFVEVDAAKLLDVLDEESVEVEENAALDGDADVVFVDAGLVGSEVYEAPQ